MPDKNTARTTTLGSLQQRMGYVFKDASLLESALTHPSTSLRNKNTARTYERLEFFGDRVLGLVMAEWLLELYPDIDEGELARHHAAAVKRDTLHKVAQKLQLLQCLRLAKSESQNERGQANISADALEALMAAIYLDGGLKPAQKFIRAHFSGLLNPTAMAPRDPKTALQEWAQARGLAVPIYSIESHSGPAHAPVFVVKVTVGKEKPVNAEGKSKQAAEKLAAEQLLQRLKDK